jgi:hypothetical protein
VTNPTFLVVVAIIIVLLCAGILFERFQECKAKGGSVCLPNPWPSNSSR